MALHLADFVTLARVPLAIGVAFAALAELRGWTIALAVAAALTDVVDGWLARHFGTASGRGALLDSWADAILAMSLVVALVELVPASEWVPWIVLSAAVIVAIRLGVALLARARSQPMIGHGWLNKAAGLAAIIAVIWSLATAAFPPMVCAVALAVGFVAALAEGRSVLAVRQGP